MALGDTGNMGQLINGGSTPAISLGQRAKFPTLNLGSLAPKTLTPAQMKTNANVGNLMSGALNPAQPQAKTSTAPINQNAQGLNIPQALAASSQGNLGMPQTPSTTPSTLYPTTCACKASLSAVSDFSIP